MLTNSKLHFIFFYFFQRLGTASNLKKSRLELPTVSNVTTTKLQTPIAKRNLLAEYNKSTGTFAKPKSTTNSQKSPFKRVLSTMAQTTALLRRVSKFKIIYIAWYIITNYL